MSQSERVGGCPFRVVSRTRGKARAKEKEKEKERAVSTELVQGDYNEPDKKTRSGVASRLFAMATVAHPAAPLQIFRHVQSLYD
jgi:hypothetical protein